MWGTKGMSASDLTNAAFLFVLVGVVLSVGVWINKDLGEQAFTSEAVVNESVTFTNGSFKALNFNYLDSITMIHNDTNSGTNVVDAANYTTRVNANGVSEVNLTYVCGSDTSQALVFNVSYSMYENVTGYMAIRNSSEGLSTLTEWLPVIAIVVAAGIVISTLIVAFTFRKNDGI